MTLFVASRRLAAAVLLFALAGCSAAGKELIGNPENPYPLAKPSKVGQIVHLPTGTLVTPEQMYSIAGDARIVYVGETHDNPASHRLELDTLQAMADRHPGKLALGMEIFVPSQQPVLDRWVGGELDEKSFLKESRWFENWKMDFGYYRDLLVFARERHIPVVALNAEKSLVKTIREKKPEEFSAEEKAKLPELDFTDPYQRALVTEIFGGHVHGGMQLDGFVRAQTLWDETMAESAANYLKSEAGKDKRLLVIAGGDHISYGFGIPRRVFRRLPASYVTIGGHEIDVAESKKDRLMEVDLPLFPMVPYDFLAYFGYEDLPQTGVRLGVMMETAKGGGLAVTGVLPGSAAEKAGIRKGDTILTFDGEKMAESLDLVYAVKKKKASDHGRLQIEREGKKLEIEVLFQAAPEGDPHGKK